MKFVMDGHCECGADIPVDVVRPVCCPECGEKLNYFLLDNALRIRDESFGKELPAELEPLVESTIRAIREAIKAGIFQRSYSEHIFVRVILSDTCMVPEEMSIKNVAKALVYEDHDAAAMIRAAARSSTAMNAGAIPHAANTRCNQACPGDVGC